MKYFYVYAIINLINNKIYIGKSNSNKNRYKDHLNIAKNKYPSSYSFIHKAINKYGSDNFKFEILEKFDDETAAYDAEAKYIIIHKSNDSEFGYNLNSGGNRSFKQSEETKQKIRDKRMGFKFSKESIEKMRTSHLGQIPVSRKFNEQDIILIKNDYAEYKKLKLKHIIKKLSEKYSCSKCCMNSIVYNLNYKHVICETNSSIPAGMKVCSRCNLILDINEFNKEHRSNDGHCGRCRACEKQYSKAKKAKISN